MWRMLPGRVYVARGYLPVGEHRIRINGGELAQSVKVEGQYAVVPLRLYHNSVLQGDVATIGQLAATAPVAVAEPSTAADPVAKKPRPRRPARAPQRALDKAPAPSAAQ
jgi:hypothetical protein